MKVRIQDNSVRFRITLEELEQLNASGRIEAVSELYSEDGVSCEGRFVYGVAVALDEPAGYCQMQPGSIFLYLSKRDLARLNDPAEEGVYLRREVNLKSGEAHRFIAFIEKDRPPTKCDKPEEWIYQRRPGEAPVTRPIKNKVQGEKRP